MKTEDKERIEKDAKLFAEYNYGADVTAGALYRGFYEGSIAESKKRSEEVKRLRIQIKIEQDANETLRREHQKLTEQLKQERNKAIDVQKILTNSEGINHLKWIYDRMIYVIGENPNMDYMHKFKSIIETLTAHGEH